MALLQWLSIATNAIFGSIKVSFFLLPNAFVYVFIYSFVYLLICLFIYLFYLGFLSRSFTNHRTTGGSFSAMFAHGSASLQPFPCGVDISEVPGCHLLQQMSSQ